MTTQYKIGGDSGTGYHFWSSYGSCPRKATLDTIARADSPGGATGVFAFDRGIAWHAFLELYYSHKNPDPDDIEFVPDLDPSAVLEAARCFEWYTDKFSEYEFGSLPICELKLPVAGDDEMRQRIEAAVGIAPFTMRPDVATSWIDDNAARLLYDTRGLEVEPGCYYLVDHKLYARHEAILLDRLINSLQFTAYQTGWNAAFPDKQVNGMIVNAVFTTKVPKALSVLVPPPSEAQTRCLREALAGWKWRRDNQPDLPNPTEWNCFGFSPCRWWQDATCDRTSLTAPLVQIGAAV